MVKNNDKYNGTIICFLLYKQAIICVLNWLKKKKANQKIKNQNIVWDSYLYQKLNDLNWLPKLN